jgi:hypothetical protein
MIVKHGDKCLIEGNWSWLNDWWVVWVAKFVIFRIMVDILGFWMIKRKNRRYSEKTDDTSSCQVFKMGESPLHPLRTAPKSL